MKVVNVKWYGGVKKFVEGGGVYVGRGFGSVMGNVFKIGVDGNRDEVIEKYRRWLWGKVKEGDEEVMKFFKGLKGDEELGCWCKEERCHGDVIVKCWEWLKKEGKV